MIESCSRRRMIIVIVFLICLSVFVLIIENRLTPSNAKLHINNENRSNFTDKEHCWKKETFTIIDECHPCSELEKVNKNPSVCSYARYKEKISCEATGEVYRRCDRVVWLEERHFWIFEAVAMAVGIVSGAVAYYRQRILDKRFLERIQRQVAAGI